MSINAMSRAFDAFPRIDLGARPIEQLLTSPNGRRDVEALLPEYLGKQRWFTGKGQQVEEATLGSQVPLDGASSLGMIDVRYADAPAQRYAHVLTARPVDQVDAASVLQPMAVVRAEGRDHVLFDGMSDVGAVGGLMDIMNGARSVAGRGGVVTGEGSAAMTGAMQGTKSLTVKPLSLETSNTTMLVGLPDDTQHALKLVRLHTADVEPGTPTRALDVVKGAHLTNDTDFSNTPGVYGSIEHVDDAGVPRTMAVANEFVANDGDTWKHALGEVGGMLRTAAAGDVAGADAAAARYAAAARNHGMRLGQMHGALAAGRPGSEFRAMKPTDAQLEKFAVRLDADVESTIAAVRGANVPLPGGMSVDDFERNLRATAASIRDERGSGAARDWIHTHGDFHLGQMLKQGDDVQIIDLEGSPILPLAERWERTDPLIDVARQRSSYEYAGMTGLKKFGESGEPVTPQLQARAADWSKQASSAFLDGWRSATAGASFTPGDAALPNALRRAELANALYETKYELGSRPDWVDIPLGRLTKLTGE